MLAINKLAPKVNKVIRVATASEELDRHHKAEELLQLNGKLSSLQENLKKVEEFIEQEKKAVKITFHGKLTGQTSIGTCPEQWEPLGQLFWFRDKRHGTEFYDADPKNPPPYNQEYWFWTHADVCRRK